MCDGHFFSLQTTTMISMSLLHQLSHLPLTPSNPSFLRLISSRSHFKPNSSTIHRQIPTAMNSNLTKVTSTPTDTYKCNLMLSNLGRSHNIRKARELFDQMLHRDVVTYATMINLYLKNGDLPLAELLYREVPEKNLVIESAMVDGYSKAGRIKQARMIFDAMAVRNVYSWTSLISGYCRIGQVGEARRLFDDMPARNVVSWTTMVLGYARNGSVSDARELFDRMPEKNVVSWTAMIKVYVDNGAVDEALQLFDRVPHRNVYTWNVMISGCLDGGRVSDAIRLFRSIPQRNTVSWTTMVSGLARNGLIDEASDLFDQMPHKDIAAWNAMITAYAENGVMVKARRLFDLMKDTNVVTWNCMIDGYAKNGCREEAVELLLLMFHSQVKLNAATLTIVLGACDSTVDVMQIHLLAMKLGLESDTSFANALLTMYSRSGNLCSAWTVFDKLEAKDVISWTSLILACSNHGCGLAALHVFAKMLRHGAQPDSISFVGILSACSHAGLVQKGRMIFDSMTRVYSLEPKAGHYSCLVDLFGRAGLVDEALKVVSEMPPGKCDDAVLGALLSACNVHGKTEVASHIGEELIEMEPSGSGGYVLLANAFALTGKWNDAARVRKVMKERKVQKVPGFSRIELRMRSHVFYAGDKSHPECEQIYDMLDDMLLPQIKGNAMREYLFI